MNGLILGGNLLNSTRNELLDLLGCRSGPRTSRDADAHGDFRILSLRHGLIAEPTPHQDSGQKHPGTVRMLDEEPWNIPAIGDVLLAFVCHFSLTSMEESVSNPRPSIRRLQPRRSFPLALHHQLPHRSRAFRLA